MTNDHAIDVIIPVCNGEKYIAAALRSAVEQTCPPQRILVVDDASRDRTVEVVRSFEHPRIPIIWLQQPRNLGPSAARNRALPQATAPYIAFLDADDIWLPTKLAAQIALFRRPRYRNLAIVSCSHLLINAAGKLLSPIPEPLIARPRGYIFDRLLTGNVVSNGSAALVKRQCLEVAGGFDESMRTCEDWDVWLRILRHHTFDHLDEPLLYIRHHGGNASSNRSRMLLGNIRLFNKWTHYAKRRPAVLRGWRTFAVRMLLASVKELPRTQLIHELAALMSPELRQLFVRQALPVVLTVAQRMGVRALRDLGLMARDDTTPDHHLSQAA